MTRRLVVLLFVLSMLAVRQARAQDQGNFERWEKAIAAYEQQDKDKPPPKNGVVFVGSSSIRLWDLKKSFPDVVAINRGFGGSQLADSVQFAPRLVSKHEPRLVVLYAGDNDIAAGKSAEQVFADFQAFTRVIHKDLPKTKIAFIGIKPSSARWKLIDKVRKANSLISESCKKDERLMFVDVDKAMLGDDGKPRAELFLRDGLHLNEKGYLVWNSLLKPYLK